MPLNLSNLKIIEDVEVPAGKHGRTRADNPMTPVLAAMPLGGKGKQFPDVPNGDARELVNLIRYAANELLIGARIVLVPPDGHPQAGRELALARTIDDDGEKTGHDIVYKGTEKTDTPEDYIDSVNVFFAARKRKVRKAKPAEDGGTDEGEDDDANENENEDGGTDEPAVPEAEAAPKMPRRRRGSRSGVAE